MHEQKLGILSCMYTTPVSTFMDLFEESLEKSAASDATRHDRNRDWSAAADIEARLKAIMQHLVKICVEYSARQELRFELCIWSIELVLHLRVFILILDTCKKLSSSPKTPGWLSRPIASPSTSISPRQ